MKHLYLLRHAKSSWDDPSLNDYERPLSKRGETNCNKIETFLSQKKIIPDISYVSSARRTVDTFNLVLGKTLKTGSKVVFSKKLYLCDEIYLFDLIKNTENNYSSILIVNHEPTIRNLTIHLSVPSQDEKYLKIKNKFPTGSLAILKSDLKDWNELKYNSFKVTDFVRPRFL